MYVYTFALAIYSETFVLALCKCSGSLQSITSLFAVEHDLKLYPQLYSNVTDKYQDSRDSFQSKLL